jgi:hypothetical protein
MALMRFIAAAGKGAISVFEDTQSIRKSGDDLVVQFCTLVDGSPVTAVATSAGCLDLNVVGHLSISIGWEEIFQVYGQPASEETVLSKIDEVSRELGQGVREALHMAREAISQLCRHEGQLEYSPEQGVICSACKEPVEACCFCRPSLPSEANECGPCANLREEEMGQMQADARAHMRDEI